MDFTPEAEHFLTIIEGSLSPGKRVTHEDQSDIHYSNFAALFQTGWTAHKTHQAVDIMKFCGGESRTTILLKRRSVRTGENFDILVGHDMLNKEHVKWMWQYVLEAEPICIIASSPCTGLAGWASLNRIINPESWHQSRSISVPLGKLAG